MKAIAISAYACLPQHAAARIVTQRVAGSRTTDSTHAKGPAVHLTPRQLEVLSLLCEGLPNKLICRRLDIAAGTVKVHMSCILRELGVNSRLQAVVCARRWGLVSDSVDSISDGSGGSEPDAAYLSTVKPVRTSGPRRPVQSLLNV